VNSGIEMRASRQKGVWSHLSAGQYPWEAIVIFFRHLYTKLYWITSRRFTNYFLYIHLGGNYGAGRLGAGDLVASRQWKGGAWWNGGSGLIVLATRQTGGVRDGRWIGSGQGIAEQGWQLQRGGVENQWQGNCKATNCPAASLR
jgi:hypothetical protein